MKLFTKRHLGAMLAALLASNLASAAIITDAGAFFNTDVGMVDGFEGVISKADLGTLQTDLCGIAGNGNSPAGESCWVNTLVGGLSFTDKEETVSVYDTNMAGVRAFQLDGDTPDYFLVKNAQFLALFENKADLGWGVIDISGFDDKFNLDGTTISHVSRFDGDKPPPPPPPVATPEPATLAMLGLGMVALGLRRRRKA